MVEDQVAGEKPLEGCFVAFQGRPPRISVRSIADAVCKYRVHHLPELVAKGRTAYVARSRQMVMWLADRIRPDMSFLTIARMLGRSDHTTVVWGINKIDRLIQSGCPKTIGDLVAVCRDLGIETVDMSAPRAGRLSAVAVEERSRRERKEGRWVKSVMPIDAPPEEAQGPVAEGNNSAGSGLAP